MYYRNGREAKDGDKIVKLDEGKIESIGIFHSDVNIGNLKLDDYIHVDDVVGLQGVWGTNGS